MPATHDAHANNNTANTNRKLKNHRNQPRK